MTKIDQDSLQTLALLAYDRKWWEYGFVDQQFLATQLARFQIGDDPNEEHYRFEAFQRVLATHQSFDDTMLARYIELAELDDDQVMSTSARINLVRWQHLSETQRTRLCDHPAFAEPVVQRAFEKASKRVPEPTFFATPADLRAWFDAHHETERELLVGFYKKGSGRPSITWPESVDEALCVGWIDGVRRSRDAESYTIRFTPRKPRSIWSSVNIARVADLTTQGRMRPAGLAAFAARAEERSSVYAYEQAADATLTAEEEAAFRADPAAWDYFNARPASYRRSALWWVISAKRPETRRQRLATLIADSAAARTLKHLTRIPAKKNDE